MNRWFIPQWLIDKKTYNPFYRCEKCHQVNDDKHIVLHSKNTGKWYTFKRLERHPTKFGWIVSRGWVPKYFAGVIEKLTN